MNENEGVIACNPGVSTLEESEESSDMFVLPAYVAIYWNNHHYFFHPVRYVTGAILWVNLNLLF